LQASCARSRGYVCRLPAFRGLDGEMLGPYGDESSRFLFGDARCCTRVGERDMVGRAVRIDEMRHDYYDHMPRLRSQCLI
jgi:hypothetical protein